MSGLSRMLGDIFKATRGKLGLSQSEAGRGAGVDPRTVLNIENYRGNPRFSSIYPLVRFYKMDANVLFYPEKQQESPAISKLRVLINGCTEEEAAAIFPIVESALNMARNKTNLDV